MAMSTTETGSTTRHMVKVVMYTQTEPRIKENGEMTNSTGKALKHGLMVLNTMGNILKEKSMEMEH